jgi:hypothetical protein
MAGHEPPTPAAQRPLAPTAILGGALALYRRRWPTLLAIGALGAPLVVSFPSTTALPGPGSEYQVIVHHRAVATAGSWAATAVVILAAVVAVLAVAVVAGALTRAALAAAAGRDLGVGGGYRYAIGRAWPLLQVLLLTWLLVTIGFVLLVFPGVIVGVQLAVAVPALVAEGGRGRDAIARSWNLVGGRWWRTFGAILLTWLLVAVTVGLVGGAVGLVGDGWLAQTVAQAIAVALTMPLVALVGALLYLDLRDRPRPTAAGAGGLP